MRRKKPKGQIQRRKDRTKTERLCRICRKNLPQSRYFHHLECEPIVDYYDMADKYGWLV